MQSRDDFLNWVKDRNPQETEFVQAVSELSASIWPVLEASQDLQDQRIIERLSEPDRAVSFRVVWTRDDGDVEINRGYRVQFCNALGPYKGGLRFHPSVNQSVLKFLGFEQIFKNALTGLPMGGGKGGADFDPSGCNDGEIMRFCHAYMRELHRHIGPDIDIPAGDIGVGAREIGYLFGAYKAMTNEFGTVLTGKQPVFGGSEMRTEATGYGLVYFVSCMLGDADMDIDGMRVCISGAGNVATHAAEKMIDHGAKVITLSDSKGTLVVEDGLTREQVADIRQHKASGGGSLEAVADAVSGTWHAGDAPWKVACDIALPCATQNELDEKAAKTLIDNGVRLVAEGANMPCTADAIEAFRSADIYFGPAKAANAGGVAMSGLEISQNRMRMYKGRDELADLLKSIMHDIHDTCLNAAKDAGHGRDYAHGANIAAFQKVSKALMAFGAI